MNNKRIPSLEDISPTQGVDLDERSALESFLGKTAKQAEQIFMSNPFHYQEDLMWMGNYGFVYYFPSFCKVAMSPVGRTPEVLDSLIRLIKFRNQFSSESLSEILGVATETIANCLDSINEYKLDSARARGFQRRLRLLLIQLDHR